MKWITKSTEEAFNGKVKQSRHPPKLKQQQPRASRKTSYTIQKFLKRPWELMGTCFQKTSVSWTCSKVAPSLKRENFNFQPSKICLRVLLYLSDIKHAPDGWGTADISIIAYTPYLHNLDLLSSCPPAWILFGIP